MASMNLNFQRSLRRLPWRWARIHSGSSTLLARSRQARTFHAPHSNPSRHSKTTLSRMHKNPSFQQLAAIRVMTTSSWPTLQSPTQQDIVAFREILNHQPGSVLTESDDLERYNTDWTKHYQGNSSIVLRPSSTGQVSSILRYCHDNYLGVVPQAGNTGLVGGSIPLNNHDHVILSVNRMNHIISWNRTTQILTGQAGGVLQEWQDYAKRHNAILPIDLGSKGSCCIGGTVSTNAGGQYYARYKSLHANVVGLEVVVPNGDILQFNLRETDDEEVLCNLKDNTGYDLKHLFIGAEGTLGVVTKVALWCSSSFPTSRCAVLCACDSLEQIFDALQLARTTLGETLAAFEFMDGSVTHLVANNPIIQHDGNTAQMIPRNKVRQSSSVGEFYPYYILVETHGSDSQHDEEKMQTFLEKSLEQGSVLDGVLAQDLTQVESLWKIRESCNPCCAALGYTYKYDVSLPMSEFANFSSIWKERLQSCGVVVVISNWGHIMDGNLHFNVTTPGCFDLNLKVLNSLEPYIFESVIDLGGSISAEHGLGQSKQKYLPMVHDAATLLVMQSIKQLFDPRGIMNPGKYLPQPR